MSQTKRFCAAEKHWSFWTAYSEVPTKKKKKKKVNPVSFQKNPIGNLPTTQRKQFLSWETLISQPSTCFHCMMLFFGWVVTITTMTSTVHLCLSSTTGVSPVWFRAWWSVRTRGAKVSTARWLSPRASSAAWCPSPSTRCSWLWLTTTLRVRPAMRWSSPPRREVRTAVMFSTGVALHWPRHPETFRCNEKHRPYYTPHTGYGTSNLVLLKTLSHESKISWVARGCVCAGFFTLPPSPDLPMNYGGLFIKT